MAKMHEDMNQRVHAATPILNANPHVMENPVPPQGNILVHIPVGAPNGVSPVILNPLVIKIDD